MLNNFFMEMKTSQNFLALLKKRRNFDKLTKFDITLPLSTQQLPAYFELLLSLTGCSAEKGLYTNTYLENKK